MCSPPLLRWYLEYGLQVIFKYLSRESRVTPSSNHFALIKSHGEAVSDARRAGDVDPSKSIIADTMKLVSCCLCFTNLHITGD